MKKVAFLLLLLAMTAIAGGPERIYVRVIPKLGNGSDMLDAGMTGGCYVRYGEECKGLFFFGDNGSGMRMGTLRDEELQGKRFEMLYSLTRTQKDNRDVLVGTVYAMQIDDKEDIISGKRTEFEQPIDPKDENVLAHPVGKLDTGENVLLQIETSAAAPMADDSAGRFPVVLVSTQLENGKQCSQVKNRDANFGNRFAFRGSFTRPGRNDSQEELQYQIAVQIKSALDLATWAATASPGQTVDGQLDFQRQYAVNVTNKGGSPVLERMAYQSQYTKAITLVAGQKLTLVFPPDTPSVHGFNIEDTLIIAP